MNLKTQIETKRTAKDQDQQRDTVNPSYTSTRHSVYYTDFVLRLASIVTKDLKTMQCSRGNLCHHTQKYIYNSVVSRVHGPPPKTTQRGTETLKHPVYIQSRIILQGKTKWQSHELDPESIHLQKTSPRSQVTGLILSNTFKSHFLKVHSFFMNNLLNVQERRGHLRRKVIF